MKKQLQHLKNNFEYNKTKLNNQKKVKLKKYLLVIVLVFCFTNYSFSQVTQYFTITNKTGLTIDKIFVAPVTDSEIWSSNILIKESFINGETANMFFNKSEFPEDCVWDLKVFDNNGNTFIWYDIDLCRFNKIILQRDDRKNKNWVEFE